MWAWWCSRGGRLRSLEGSDFLHRRRARSTIDVDEVTDAYIAQLETGKKTNSSLEVLLPADHCEGERSHDP